MWIPGPQGPESTYGSPRTARRSATEDSSQFEESSVVFKESIRILNKIRRNPLLQADFCGFS